MLNRRLSGPGKLDDMSKEEMEKELKSILDEYSPLLQDVTTDDVKQKVKEKRLPRLKKVSSTSLPNDEESSSDPQK